MVIHFGKTLQESLEVIKSSEYLPFPIHAAERVTDHSDELIGLYGDAKWAIVDLINERYSQVLDKPIDLINWLHHENDELSYFLNEVGSNSLNYSQFKAPSNFHLWLGKKGFVVGIEQKGASFNAEIIDQQVIKQNEGAAFDFFRRCASVIFFDDSREARVVYMEFIFS